MHLADLADSVVADRAAGLTKEAISGSKSSSHCRKLQPEQKRKLKSINTIHANPAMVRELPLPQVYPRVLPVTGQDMLPGLQTHCLDRCKLLPVSYTHLRAHETVL